MHRRDFLKYTVGLMSLGILRAWSKAEGEFFRKKVQKIRHVKWVWVKRGGAKAYEKPDQSARMLYSLHGGSMHWVRSKVIDAYGRIWICLDQDRIWKRPYYVLKERLMPLRQEDLKPIHRHHKGKVIRISLKRQILEAWEGDREVYRALISSGIPHRFDTPRGVFSIESKAWSLHMKNMNYDLDGVPFVMFFNGNYGIHGTYWHDQFGKPVSHGCINLNIRDAKWLFLWTDPPIRYEISGLKRVNSAIPVEIQ